MRFPPSGKWCCFCPIDGLFANTAALSRPALHYRVVVRADNLFSYFTGAVAHSGGTHAHTHHLPRACAAAHCALWRAIAVPPILIFTFTTTHVVCDNNLTGCGFSNSILTPEYSARIFVLRRRGALPPPYLSGNHPTRFSRHSYPLSSKPNILSYMIGCGWMYDRRGVPQAPEDHFQTLKGADTKRFIKHVNGGGGFAPYPPSFQRCNVSNNSFQLPGNVVPAAKRQPSYNVYFGNTGNRRMVAGW